MEHYTGISQVQKYFADRKKQKRQIRWSKFVSKVEKKWKWIQDLEKWLPTLDEAEVIIITLFVIVGLSGAVFYVYTIYNTPLIDHNIIFDGQ